MFGHHADVWDTDPETAGAVLAAHAVTAIFARRQGEQLPSALLTPKSAQRVIDPDGEGTHVVLGSKTLWFLPASVAVQNVSALPGGVLHDGTLSLLCLRRFVGTRTNWSANPHLFFTYLALCQQPGAIMHKTIAIISATGALLFGGAGVAGAAVHGASAPSSTAVTLADNTNGTTDQHTDNSGKWGMFGLLGLFGLAGLKRRNTTNANIGAAPTAN
ncbi:MAG: WGxxGxxG family protein, partial [Mycobacterium sp.]